MCYIREINQPKEYIKRYDEIQDSIKFCKQSQKLKFIALSLYNILDNYAIKARLLDKTINFYGQDIDFQLIVSFKVAIHLCEFEKLSQIMGLNFKFNRSKEYWNMKDYLGLYSLTLNSILEYSSEDYNYL